MHSTRQIGRRAFTLTELMVAITVLVGILLASSKIFSTTSRVSSVGEANADVLLDVGAIERQLRADIGQLAREGVFGIRCIAVRNDIQGAGTALNPSLPPDAVIRADQLLFFTNSERGVNTFIASSGFNDGERRGRGMTSRMYYGHAFQLGTAGRPIQTNPARGYDVNGKVWPWRTGTIETTNTAMEGGGTFNTSGDGTVVVPPVDARQWLMVRHPAIMVDDGGDTRVFLNDIRTARSIFYNDPLIGFTPELQKGRVDAANTTLKELRERLLYEDPTVALPIQRPWKDDATATPDSQYGLVRDELIYYPRAERYSPSMHRVDQALTNNVLLNACSSITIDWTWAEGTGEIRNEADDSLLWKGVTYNESGHRWFGLRDSLIPRVDQQRGVYRYGNLEVNDLAETIFPFNIEEETIDGSVATYTAVFGFNQLDSINPQTGVPDVNLGYTPWPSAIRVTVTVHDSRTVLEGGREIQFVIDLPDRYAR